MSDDTKSEIGLTIDDTLEREMRAASAVAALDATYARINTSSLSHATNHLANYHSRRAKLLHDGGAPDKAQRDDWHTLAFAADETQPIVGQTIPDLEARNGGPLLRSYHGTAADAHFPWHSVPPECFAMYWVSGRDPACPLIARARYLLALWDLRRLWQSSVSVVGARPIDAAKEAVAALMALAEVASAGPGDPATQGMLAAQSWQLAIFIALSIRQPNWLNGGLSAMRATIKACAADAPHWSVGLIECELYVAESSGKRNSLQVSNDRLRELQAELKALRPSITAAFDYIEPAILRADEQVEKLLGSPPSQQELARREAQMHSDHASRSSCTLVAAVRWRDAAAAYQQAGLSAEAEDAKAKSRASMQTARVDGSFQEIRGEIPLTPAQSEALIAPYFDGAASPSDVLERLGLELFAPPLGKDGTFRVEARSFWATVATTIPIVDDRILGVIAPNEPDQQLQEARREYVVSVQLYAALSLSPALARLQTDWKMSAEELTNAFRVSAIVTSSEVPLLRTAMERYLAGDVASCIHILAPRVERLIRRDLTDVGANVTALTDGKMQERTLGELIRRAEADGKLPTPVARLFQACLSEDWGLNLRNNVAHGLLDGAAFTTAIADRLLHIALLVSQRSYRNS